MAITRAKATGLLNKTEMGLFDDSRSNAVRAHSEARLNQLVTRARTARDRARDLEKRQRIASQGTTGSKSGKSGQANARTGEKIEVLSDILARFEARQSQAGSPAKTAKTTKVVKSAGRAKTAKTVTKKTAQAGPAPTKTATKKPAARKVATKTSADAASGATGRATKTVSRRAVKKAGSASSTSATKGKGADKTSSGSARSAKALSATPSSELTKRANSGDRNSITPEKALKNTRKLLKTREAEAKASKSWKTVGADGATETAPGFQSPRARNKALDLHAAEIRQTSNQGSVSTRGRKSQGKRDNRNSNDG